MGWSNGEVIVLYLTCEDCEKKGYHVAEDRGQEIVKGKEWEKLKKCRECSEKGKGKAVHPIKEKVQQSDAWTRDPEGAAKEEGSQREVLSQMVTYLICDLRKSSSKEFKARFR